MNKTRGLSMADVMESPLVFQMLLLLIDFFQVFHPCAHIFKKQI